MEHHKARDIPRVVQSPGHGNVKTAPAGSLPKGYTLNDSIINMAYPSFTHEDLIVNWFKRSQNDASGIFTIFDRFISLWFSFNSWGTYLTRKDKDWQMVDEIKKSELLGITFDKLSTSDPEFQRDLGRLAKYEVLDMRPSHESGSKSIKDTKDFGQLVDVIYLIRCNLFHGRKSEIDPHDRELVELAFRILSKIYKPAIDELVRGINR